MDGQRQKFHLRFGSKQNPFDVFILVLFSPRFWTGFKGLLIVVSVSDVNVNERTDLVASLYR